MLNDEEDGLEALNAAMASGEPPHSTHCGRGRPAAVLA